MFTTTSTAATLFGIPRKAAGNPGKHDRVTFEQAATVFFDPLFRLVDAERNDEARDAIIGFDAQGRL